MTVFDPILRIALVADDLTGAADSAVQFADAGWPVQLLRNLPILERAEDSRSGGDSERSGVLAVATGVRAADRADAAAATARTVQRLRGAVDRLFLKIDSTARGSIDGQVAGALAAWQLDHPEAVAVICPAFPDLGRTVRDGQVLVDGRPAHQSAAAVDPVSPLAQSRLDRVVDGAVLVDVTDLESGSGDRMLCDAETNQDLDALAVALLMMGSRAIAVGSAGLAAAVARCWSQPNAGRDSRSTTARSARVLVGVSSLHPAALVQLQRLLATTEFGSAVEVVTTPGDRRDGGPHPAAIARTFGERVAHVLVRELRCRSPGRWRRSRSRARPPWRHPDHDQLVDPARDS